MCNQHHLDSNSRDYKLANIYTDNICYMFYIYISVIYAICAVFKGPVYCLPINHSCLTPKQMINSYIHIVINL